MKPDKNGLFWTFYISPDILLVHRGSYNAGQIHERMSRAQYALMKQLSYS